MTENSELKKIEVVCFDNDATPFATFQSHNQKVVSNKNGIFLTYIRTRNVPYTEQHWRLIWSKDGGKSFEILYESVDPTNPAPVETDEDNNIYLVYPNFIDKHSYFMIFKASENYKNPKTIQIKNSMGGKFALAYDKFRKIFYYFSNNNTFHILNREGDILHSYNITKYGKTAEVEYPQLIVDSEGLLHTAWTTNTYGNMHYWSIHYMVSEDGGYNWKHFDGTPIELPVFSDENGNTDRITTDNLFVDSTWLSSFTAKKGKLHFIFRACPHPDYKDCMTDHEDGKQHYIRYDINSGKKDFEILPKFGGKLIDINGVDGFFSIDSKADDFTVYYVCRQDKRLACVVSYDNGLTWQDFAVSVDLVDADLCLYATGGCREITEDGYIIGSFTERCGDFKDPFCKSKAYFIKIRV